MQNDQVSSIDQQTIDMSCTGKRKFSIVTYDATFSLAFNSILAMELGLTGFK